MHSNHFSTMCLSVLALLIHAPFVVSGETYSCGLYAGSVTYIKVSGDLTTCNNHADSLNELVGECAGTVSELSCGVVDQIDGADIYALIDAGVSAT